VLESPSSIPPFYSKMCSMTSGFPNKLRKVVAVSCTQPLIQTHDNYSTIPPDLLPATTNERRPGAGVKAGGGHP
jgi:hypothetical protein